ncbi:twin-arginine translocation signal domain-containing protein [Parvibaculum indicum]
MQRRARLSRRGFLKAGGASAAGMAMPGLAGMWCRPSIAL